MMHTFAFLPAPAPAPGSDFSCADVPAIHLERIKLTVLHKVVGCSGTNTPLHTAYFYVSFLQHVVSAQNMRLTRTASPGKHVLRRGIYAQPTTTHSGRSRWRMPLTLFKHKEGSCYLFPSSESRIFCMKRVREKKSPEK